MWMIVSYSQTHSCAHGLETTWHSVCSHQMNCVNSRNGFDDDYGTKSIDIIIIVIDVL